MAKLLAKTCARTANQKKGFLEKNEEAREERWLLEAGFEQVF